MELWPAEHAATKVAANYVRRNADQFLPLESNSIDIKNISDAFKAYERRLHVSSNFKHTCNFVFYGGPEYSREQEESAPLRWANQNFIFYEIYRPVFKPGPDVKKFRESLKLVKSAVEKQRSSGDSEKL